MLRAGVLAERPSTLEALDRGPNVAKGEFPTLHGRLGVGVGRCEFPHWAIGVPMTGSVALLEIASGPEVFEKVGHK